MNHDLHSDGRRVTDDDAAHVFHSWSAQSLISPLPVASAEGARNWSIGFDLYFVTSGSYTVETWAAELSTGSILSQINTANILADSGTVPGNGLQVIEGTGGNDDLDPYDGLVGSIDGTTDMIMPIDDYSNLTKIEDG